MKYKVLWIDPAVRDYQVFVDSVNEDTLALVYPEPLVFDVERIGFVFELHSPMALWLQENASVLIGSGVKHMDFLACDTLPSWQPYYDTLTGITVGASNNRTGNLQYGGDWLMESTCEDVERVYFTRSIEYYKYLLSVAENSLYVIDTSKRLWQSGVDTNIGSSVSNSYLTPTTLLNIDKISYYYNNTGLYISNKKLFSGRPAGPGTPPVNTQSELNDVTDVAVNNSRGYVISGGKLYSSSTLSTINTWTIVKNGALDITAQRVSCCENNTAPLQMIYLSDGFVYDSNCSRISPT
jgi:hypothetical protein